MPPEITGSGRYTLPVSALLIATADYSANDPAAVEFSTLGATALILTCNVATQSGSGNTVTFNVEWYDPASQTWVPLGTALALIATGVAKVIVDPRITAGANSYQSPVPARVRVRPVGSGTRTTLTYAVGVQLCF